MNDKDFISNSIKKFGNFFFLNIMRQWVAGGSIENVIDYVKKLKDNKHSTAIINHLGEHYVEKVVIERIVEEYKKLIDAIANNKLDAGITIKLSQFGCNCKN